jgi:hypothetical protein
LQVSRHTGRIHLYSCVPGHDSRPKPLFENFLPEELNSPCSSSEVKARTLLLKKIPAFCNVFRAFIKEWLALRPIDQSRLLGKPLQLPLSLELCFLKDSVNHSTEVCTFLFIWFFSLHSSFAYEQDIFKSSYVSFSKEIQYICMIHSNIYLCNDTKSMGMYSRSQGYYNVLKRVSPCDFHHQKTTFLYFDGTEAKLKDPFSICWTSTINKITQLSTIALKVQSTSYLHNELSYTLMEQKQS